MRRGSNNGQRSDKDVAETLLIPCRSSSDKEDNKVTNLDSTFFSIENKPFRIYTNFFIGNKDKLEKELKKHEKVDIKELQIDDEKTFSGITIPCTTASGHSFVLIWMTDFHWSLDDFETLSHECLHATVMVMRMSGVRSKIFSAEDDENCDDEGIAYSQSTMFTTILKELVKRQNRAFKNEITKRKNLKSKKK